MNIYIVIPAHNEEDNIALMLETLVQQTLQPKKVVIVNDNSTDNTQEIITLFTKKHHWITSLSITSSQEHVPGSKVINAFNQGLKTLDDAYDIICKFDADIILPKNYLKNIVSLFNSDETIGIAGGLAYIKKGETWIYETIASKNHVRGPFKAYRKACFKTIGGLKESIGWDTVDVLLAQYHGWRIKTDQTLKVKHLKPTSKTYNKNSRYLQGEALYKMRFGFVLACIFSLRNTISKRSPSYFFNTITGFFKAQRKAINFIVTENEGDFIRKKLWKNLRQKFI
jgi:cellulose synthase/poly-beta-1,6-N-acetylglucosamine synthase-like glycosyltransferase